MIINNIIIIGRLFVLFFTVLVVCCHCTTVVPWYRRDPFSYTCQKATQFIPVEKKLWVAENLVISYHSLIGIAQRFDLLLMTYSRNDCVFVCLDLLGGHDTNL